MDNELKWASAEHQRFVVFGVWLVTSNLVVGIHNRRIGSFHMRNCQQRSHWPILRMSLNEASMIFSSAFWVIDVPMGFRHLFMRYSKTLDEKTTAT
jgi:hypothetical protein